MTQRILLAGATGVIGSRLAPLLRGAGYDVVGTTRSAEKAEALRTLGVVPLVVDVFDADALTRAAVKARPDIVIHQLTDLPRGLDPARMSAAIARNARIREQGTRNLVAAAVAAGVQRLIAQSIAWAYAPGPEPHGEDDPLDLAATGDRAVSVRGVLALERAVLGAPLDGIVLRYGQIWGPGTGTGTPSGTSPVHVDAAAHAALLAIERGRPGVYNVAEPNAYAATAKAEAELGWSAGFRFAR